MGTERYWGITRGTKGYRVVQGDRDGDQGDTEEYNKIQKGTTTEGYREIRRGTTTEGYR